MPGTASSQLRDLFCAYAEDITRKSRKNVVINIREKKLEKRNKKTLQENCAERN